MYATLEPCSHYGKTPPCVNSIIKSRVSRVFFSVNDPDKRTFLKSEKILNKKGIRVSKGLLKNDSLKFYKSYILNKKKNIPYLASKIALSKDLYSKDKAKKWITNKLSRGRVHLLRSIHDSILTSLKTVKDDDPMLNCRIKGLEKYSPCRFILDKNLDIPIFSKIVKSSKKYKTIIFHNSEKINKIKLLKRREIKMIKISLNKDKTFDLKKVLNKIFILGYSRVFLESGYKLNYSFLKLGLINTFYLFVSDKFLKKNGLKSFNKIINYINKNKKNKTQKTVNLDNEKLFLIDLK